MDLRQLRYFVQVAELGSFTKASAQLRITQPALSRQIKRLEDELRVPLLSRAGRQASLTPAGATLFERARFLLRHSEHARAEVMDLATVPSGQVAIGMPPSLTGLVLPPLMRAVVARYPAVRVRAMEGFDSAEIEQWLVTGRADLALLYQHKPSPKLTATRLLNEPLFLVGAPARLRRRRYGARELRAMPMILPARPHGLRMFLDRVLGLGITVAVETNALAPIVALVKADVGVSVLPQSAIRAELDLGTLAARRIGPAGLHRTLALGRYREHPQTQAEREIETMVVAVVRDLIRARQWIAHSAE
jgi:LysR family nitrogen assimilation transcriptional regulator